MNPNYLRLALILILCCQSAFSNETDQQYCDRKLKRIRDYQDDAQKLFKEYESADIEARNEISRRGNKLPGQEGALTMEAWQRSVRDQEFAYRRASRKLLEARRVFDYRERPPSTGWSSYLGDWASTRRTWFANDIEELSRDRRCFRASTEINGRRMSIREAARRIDRALIRRVEQWNTRIAELDQLAKNIEANEIRRLAPDKWRHCLQVGIGKAHPRVVDEFCGRIDGVGYRKLMPFAGCIGNLRHFGYRDGRTSAYTPRGESDKRWSTKFFDACNNPEALEAMTSNDSWSRCMQRVVHQYSFPGDASRFCLREQNTAVRSSGSRGAQDLTVQPTLRRRSTPPPIRVE